MTDAGGQTQTCDDGGRRCSEARAEQAQAEARAEQAQAAASAATAHDRRAVGIDAQARTAVATASASTAASGDVGQRQIRLDGRAATASASTAASVASVAPAAGCSIQATLDVVGDRWTLLILRDLFRGVRRFSAMQHDLGIARNMLADRLGRLVAADVARKVPYQQRPVRYDYVLTPKGQDLSVCLLALMHWGDRWCHDDQAPTVLVHAECGTPLEVAARCGACDTAVSPSQIRSRPGTTITSPGPAPAAAQRVPGPAQSATAQPCVQPTAVQTADA